MGEDVNICTGVSNHHSKLDLCNTLPMMYNKIQDMITAKTFHFYACNISFSVQILTLLGRLILLNNHSQWAFWMWLSVCISCFLDFMKFSVLWRIVASYKYLQVQQNHHRKKLKSGPKSKQHDCVYVCGKTCGLWQNTDNEISRQKTVN